MSQFPHDQFAKNLLESLLSPFGLVQIAFTMSSEIREIDFRNLCKFTQKFARVGACLKYFFI